jgi:hypothetical protein
VALQFIDPLVDCMSQWKFDCSVTVIRRTWNCCEETYQNKNQQIFKLLK